MILILTCKRANSLFKFFASHLFSIQIHVVTSQILMVQSKNKLNFSLVTKNQKKEVGLFNLSKLSKKLQEKRWLLSLRIRKALKKTN